MTLTFSSPSAGVRFGWGMGCHLHMSPTPGGDGTLELSVNELSAVLVSKCPWFGGVGDVFPIFGADQNFDPPRLLRALTGPGPTTQLGAADNATLTLEALYNGPGGYQTATLSILWDPVTFAPKLFQLLANELAGAATHDPMLDTILAAVVRSWV